MPDRPEPTSEADRHETPSQRADRNFVEQLQELRVAQAGVQILFAFLLALAFQSGFPQDRRVFDAVLTAALLCSAAAATCFMAPVALHRLLFREGRKEALVWAAQWMSLIGMVFLLFAMSLSVWLVMAQLWSLTTATWTTVAMVAITLAIWVVLPLLMRAQESTIGPGSEPGSDAVSAPHSGEIDHPGIVTPPRGDSTSPE